jgi:hypothetical protein
MRIRPSTAQDAAADPPVPDWARVADGRPWRLERGVDFDGSVQSFDLSAREAASLMGKSVLLAPDRLHPARFVWLQFADGEIVYGDPCPCGSRRLWRIGVYILRCRACDATLLCARLPGSKERRREPASAPEDASGASRTPPLAAFSDLRLARADETPLERTYVGFGVDGDGRETLLFVRIPLVEGAPVPDERSPTKTVCTVVAAIPEAHRSSRLTSEAESDAWEIVVP